MTPCIDRGSGIDLPRWWLEKVNDLVAERKAGGESLVKLGKALAVAVGRPDDYNHGTVSRFLRNQHATIELADAFCALLGVPRLFFVARSLDESIAITATAKRYDGKVLTGGQAGDLAVVDAMRDREMQAAGLERSDHAAKNGPPHGESERSRRPRRATGRRPPPART